MQRVLQGADFVVDSLPLKYMKNYMDAAAEPVISGVSVNNIGEPEVLADPRIQILNNLIELS